MKATAVFAIFNARLESAFILSTLIVPAINSLYINSLFSWVRQQALEYCQHQPTLSIRLLLLSKIHLDH